MAWEEGVGRVTGSLQRDTDANLVREAQAGAPGAYSELVKSGNCTDAKTMSDRIDRTKQALIVGTRVHPPTANQMLQTLAKFEDQMPKVRHVFSCDKP